MQQDEPWQMNQIRRNFHSRDRHNFLHLYMYIQYVRPHLEFAAPFWSPWLTGDKETIKNTVLRIRNFYFGYGFGSGSSLEWVRIWIRFRIRLRIQIRGPDPDPGFESGSETGQNFFSKIKNQIEEVGTAFLLELGRHYEIWPHSRPQIFLGRKYFYRAFFESCVLEISHMAAMLRRRVTT
jgi:hypothetical protein